MQAVAGLVRLDACKKRKARQSQLTNEVQGFVSSKLVREAQRSIHDAIVGKNDGILKGASANKAHSFERLDVALETESSRARQKVAEGIGPDQHLHFLLAHERVRKIHVAAHAKLVGGVDADPAVSLDDFQRLQDFQVAPLSAQFSDT